MLNIHKIFFAIFLLCIAMHLEGAFLSPSQKQMEFARYSEMEKSYSLRKISLEDRGLYEKITEQEREGFLGYHGDSIEFLVYQDVIRLILETIVEIPIREDFHFLSAPLDPSVKIQKKEELARVFTEEENPSVLLYDSTFPLNFSLWDNYNRLGLNSLEHYKKNEPVKPLGYQRRLKWLFNHLGIKESEIERLFAIATQKLEGNAGVILQIFDESTEPYAFSKQAAYPAYPNGFISANRTVDELFLDESFLPPYPHEVRLMLNNSETLNPNNPLRIVRHTPHLDTSTLNSYEKELRSMVSKLKFSRSKKDNYQKVLKSIWGYN